MKWKYDIKTLNRKDRFCIPTNNVHFCVQFLLTIVVLNGHQLAGSYLCIADTYLCIADTYLLIADIYLCITDI
jgi:hypothetical protein